MRTKRWCLFPPSCFMRSDDKLETVNSCLGRVGQAVLLYLAALDSLLQLLQLVVALGVGPDDGGPPPVHLGHHRQAMPITQLLVKREE